MFNCFCMRDAAKTVGFGILTFSAGILVGTFCPLYVLAVIELALLTVLGYLCLFKW